METHYVFNRYEKEEEVVAMAFRYPSSQTGTWLMWLQELHSYLSIILQKNYLFESEMIDSLV